MEETWKDIKGYEGLYKISDKGNLYSIYSKRVLSPKAAKDGYIYVRLCKDNHRVVTAVHRIVALNFIKNDDLNKIEVNHKDGVKTNNCVENLEWVTKGGNLTHAYRILNIPRAAKRIKCVETEAVFESSIDAQRKTGINAGAIRQVLSGLKRKAGGYKWERI